MPGIVREMAPASVDGDWSWAGEWTVVGVPRQVCCACDASKALDDDPPYAQEEDARFCPTCWRRLSAPEIERVVRMVALRGVPLS